jgi:hypothetical protein
MRGEERDRLRPTAADVFWLAEESGRDEFGEVPTLPLEGADLVMAHLEGAELSRAHSGDAYRA